MNRITINSRAEHVALTLPWKALRGGRFPDVFADFCTDSGLSRDELQFVGWRLERLMRLRDSDRKASLLGRLGVKVCEWAGLRGRPTDDPRRKEFVELLFTLARRHDGSRSWDATYDYAKTPGYIAGAAALLSAGRGVDASMIDPESIVSVAYAAIKRDRLPVSITDVRDTLRTMTRFGAITDWVAPEDTARSREVIHRRLVQSLQSPKALSFIAAMIRDPEAGAWLCDQMWTPEERALLRNLVLALLSQTRRRT